MNVALYARISTKDGQQDVTNQLTELRAYCERSGWAIFQEYIDHESGKTGDRVQLKAMLLDSTRRKFDALVVWALDRLTREGIEKTFAYVRQLTSNGVQFVSYTEPHFRTTGPAGELMLSIAAWIAEQERRRISERTKAGLARVKAAGTRLGRPEVAVNAAEVKRLRLAGGSVRQIAVKMKLKKSVVHQALVTLGLNSSASAEPKAAEPACKPVPETTAEGAPEVGVPVSEAPVLPPAETRQPPSDHWMDDPALTPQQQHPFASPAR